RGHLVVDATSVPALELRFPARGAVVGPDGEAVTTGRSPDAEPGHPGSPPVVLAHDGETLSLDDVAPTGPVTVRLTMRRGALRLYAPSDPTAG
ncbi:MAG: hypothetical protein ACTH2O_00370, partial [Cellulosimicrobium funkei]